MNKCDRIMAALEGKDVDHVPASFWFHFPESCRAGQAMADAHLEYYEQCDPDWLKVMNDTGYDVPAGFDKGDGLYDLNALAKPVSINSQCFETFLEGFVRIMNRLKGEVPVLVTVFCPYTSFRHVVGEHADDVLRKHPEAGEQALHAITESLLAFSRVCLDEGAWGIYYSAKGGEKDLFEFYEHERFIERYDRMLLDGIKDAPFNVLHVCGENIRMEPYWGYPVKCINWAVGEKYGNPSISEGRGMTDLPIAAGLDQRGALAFGSEGALRDEIGRALDEGGRKKFLLTAGCTVPDDIDVRLLRIAREECIRQTN